MIKKLFLILFFLNIATNSYSAGSDSNSTTSKVKSDYEKAVESIKLAKKFENKGKIKKAMKRYTKAQ